MPRRYRCRHDIAAAILRAIIGRGGAKTSHIAMAAGLPLDRARGILQEMERAGLVYYDGESRAYAATERAYEWLAVYELLESIFSPPPTTGRT
ncbi:MAG: winged helix-turn-helix domain-containing protein [Thermoproteota archaeon]